MNIVQTCGVPCLNLVALYLGFGSVGLTIAAMGASILTRIAYQFYVRRKMQLRPRVKNLPTNKLKEIMGFSFWIFVANVVGQLYNATDTVMIGMIPALATTGVAVYNVGGTFNSIMSSLTTGVSGLLAPKVNKWFSRGLRRGVDRPRRPRWKDPGIYHDADRVRFYCVWEAVHCVLCR